MSVIDPAVSVRLGASSARRLVGLLAEVAQLLEDPGPLRLTTAQADALGQGTDRGELVEWTRTLAAELRAGL
ncbi:hypothetical protein AB0P12_04445 [Streptomyces subrutilus]|uniref:Uncharacterized protein n=1 Tax=Streptomyces subrutilus TaxID=36818 RepID=A0A5P2UYV7_9ACTN|nr:hypothetical protein [Streptomyces subrutilus]QEU81937.1 hypothetical protein CP968_29925 [Streptomyces subrutilus]WSJ28611.1 hypothetical protein OG479_04450 [Streptomyces subrutilus]GGZ71997.1 hypothetical protein GCM10010371_34620 [Streptomyces subrutilus]